jgi:hypothetical protein
MTRLEAQRYGERKRADNAARICEGSASDGRLSSRGWRVWIVGGGFAKVCRADKRTGECRFLSDGRVQMAECELRRQTASREIRSIERRGAESAARCRLVTQKRELIRRVQEDGSTCWCDGTVWHGHTAMRISVASWATTEEDIDRSADAVIRIAWEV